MAELGHEVLGVDSVQIESLKAGTVPFYGPGLPEADPVQVGELVNRKVIIDGRSL